MKRLFLLLFFVVQVVSSYAVLNEKNLDQTISVLRSELESYKQEQDETMQMYKSISQTQHENMINTMRKSEQVSLMLYSQKQDYTFDLAYVCHEATSMYDDFSSHQVPFNSILEKFRVEIDRYNNLIEVLEQLPPRLSKRKISSDSINKIVHLRMDADGEIDTLSHRDMIRQMMDTLKKINANNTPFMLSEKAQEDRDSCLVLAQSIKDDMISLYNSISMDSEHYTFLENRLKKMNDYAQIRYNDIKQLIFKNGGKNYISILSAFPFYLRIAQKDIQSKYYQPKDSNVRSEWRGPIVVALSLFIVFYLFVAMILSNVIVRFCVPQRFKDHEFQQKKIYYILALSFVLFSIVVLVLRSFMTHHFFLMASWLLLEYSLLVGTVLLSLLMRVSGSQIKNCFKVYAPILLMGFVIIVFRIIFISNNVVNLIFPPILLLFTIWQWHTVRRHNKKIPFSDMFFAYVSLFIIFVSCVASWFGYTLLAVQIFIWWLFQLTAIQGIICVKDIMKRNEFGFLTSRVMKRDKIDAVFPAARKAIAIMNPSKKEKGNNFEITWFYDLIRITLIPISIVMSLLLCVYMAAGIFDLTESCKLVFVKDFIDVEGVCQLSLQKMLIVIVLFFSFKFLTYMFKSSYKKYRMRYATDNGDANITLANNIISIVSWGSYFIIVLILLRIPKSGISIVTAGLATGLGFAMKDILENFIYGLSLMTGRVRVGDFIECDGIRGKVDSITYQSTQIITLDGCVIAFLNSSLFNKNFKNLTRNHDYEFTPLSVNVAYGTDVDMVRQLLKKSLEGLYEYSLNGRPSVDKVKGVNVLLSSFEENSINLDVTIWASVEDKFRISRIAKELIYDTLNKNHIEIPFPQRVVYIKGEEGK